MRLTAADHPTILLAVPEPLSRLRVADAAVVTAVEGEGPMSVRLLEMGFVPGTRVHLVKIAPLGDPLELRVRGYHVSLRRAEASKVLVKRG